jgi:hypothetical protein
MPAMQSPEYDQANQAEKTIAIPDHLKSLSPSCRCPMRFSLKSHFEPLLPGPPGNTDQARVAGSPIGDTCFQLPYMPTDILKRLYSPVRSCSIQYLENSDS